MFGDFSRTHVYPCHAYIGKVCGPEGQSAEHLLYARLSLVVHLKLLFILLFLQVFTPDGFGAGVIVRVICASYKGQIRQFGWHS